MPNSQSTHSTEKPTPRYLPLPRVPPQPHPPYSSSTTTGMWEQAPPLPPRPFQFWGTALPETRGFEEEGADGKIPIPMTKTQTLHSEKLLKSDLTKSSPETRCFP